ncbi:hypothetical protein WJ07_19385 [Burkholderia vietnamiensis]|uniref:hypothetical protein n=1 Tax=Burkholderia vietnamiensis TaxID=60552 RepID=UPI0007589F3B|nr:hypothetical protein [Burkholderia vietnamiensis]KVF21057.1 hypothetical protein WJ07_19385 [Burkholderia vietnamiensis]
MLSFYVANLLIPGDPDEVTITTPAGPWKLIKTPDFDEMKAKIATAEGRPRELPVGETYFLENPVGMHDGAAAIEKAFNEVTPILLAASYATGLSVTIERSTMGSSVGIVTPTDHWPRIRAMGPGSPVVATTAEFVHLVDAFIQAWPVAGKKEKARLLVHTWLDALACWSMEDMYLSATTLLQVIVATEKKLQRIRRLDFYPGLKAASRRKRIPKPSYEAKEMRDSLVHEGRLPGSWISAVRRAETSDKEICAGLVEEVLNWFDTYMHAALRLGPVAKVRFQAHDFVLLNAYSI